MHPGMFRVNSCTLGTATIANSMPEGGAGRLLPGGGPLTSGGCQPPGGGEAEAEVLTDTDVVSGSWSGSSCGRPPPPDKATPI